VSPTFARAVDPLFLRVVELIERIETGSGISAREERLRLLALFDESEAVVGAGREWELAKYALVSWIDEMLVETLWEGQGWWGNNVLEVELFGTRLCNEQFYIRAQEASTLARRDALEVFYDCVVLGFRGLYREPQLAKVLTEAHGLPPTLEAWTKQAAMSIRLGQGRPELPKPRREIRGAAPLRSRASVVWAWLGVVAMTTLNVVAYLVLYR
jgi:type VI secretion system protein ImpK